MKHDIILVGGGGHCKSVIDVIENTNCWRIAGILDISEKVGESIANYPIIGTDNKIASLVEGGLYFMVTVGQIKSSAVREMLFNTIQAAGGILPSIQAQTARVSNRASLAAGCIIMHNVFINSNAVIGRNCIINTAAIVEHDVCVGDHCHISTAAVLNGNVSVGMSCFIGSCAVIAHGVSLVDKVIIGAGCVVVADIKKAGVYAGVPARKIG